MSLRLNSSGEVVLSPAIRRSGITIGGGRVRKIGCLAIPTGISTAPAYAFDPVVGSGRPTTATAIDPLRVKEPVPSCANTLLYNSFVPYIPLAETVRSALLSAETARLGHPIRNEVNSSVARPAETAHTIPQNLTSIRRWLLEQTSVTDKHSCSDTIPSAIYSRDDLFSPDTEEQPSIPSRFDPTFLDVFELEPVNGDINFVDKGAEADDEGDDNGLLGAYGDEIVDTYVLNSVGDSLFPEPGIRSLLAQLGRTPTSQPTTISESLSCATSVSISSSVFTDASSSTAATTTTMTTDCFDSPDSKLWFDACESVSQTSSKVPFAPKVYQNRLDPKMGSAEQSSSFSRVTTT